MFTIALANAKKMINNLRIRSHKTLNDNMIKEREIDFIGYYKIPNSLINEFWSPYEICKGEFE